MSTLGHTADGRLSGISHVELAQKNNKRDIKTLPGTTLLTYEHTNGRVNTLRWFPDWRYVASGGHDATVRI